MARLVPEVSGRLLAMPQNLDIKRDQNHRNKKEIKILEAQVASLEKKENTALDAFYVAKRKHEAAAAQLTSRKKRKVE